MSNYRNSKVSRPIRFPSGRRGGVKQITKCTFTPHMQRSLLIIAQMISPLKEIWKRLSMLVVDNNTHYFLFPFMGTRTASPRGRYGERPQRDSVWRYIWKNTTCWPATAHDVTTGVPQYKCRREDTSSAFSSSLTGLFEACRVNLVRVQFSNSTMASTSKAFRKCVDPCPRYLTPDDTHDCCVFCLGMEHARDVLEGAVCVHCERLSVRKLSSRLSLFSRKEGQPSASRDSRPTVAEARRRMKSWGSQLVVADKLERDRPLFARRPRTRVSCWIVMMRSFWHH